VDDLAALSGLGMALLYPNLMTVPSDAAHPTWRSAGMGVYRMWRDSGYGVGAILIGLSMEFVNAEAAFYMTAILMFLSGAVVYVWMEETHPEFGTHEPPAPALRRPTARRPRTETDGGLLTAGSMPRTIGCGCHSMTRSA